MDENSILQNAGCDALEQAPVIMAIYDPELNFYWANKACRDFFGLPMSQIQGRHCHSLWKMDMLCSNCPAQKCLETGQTTEVEVIPEHWEHWSQSQACWQVKASPLRDQSGRISGVIVVVLDMSADKQTEAALEETNRRLGERVKEFNCLYRLSSLFADRSISEPELLQRAVQLIPPSWQYPDITCARLVWQDQEYSTDNFQETDWQLSSDILLKGTQRGYVQVCYLEERPAIHEGPFLQEERSLLDTLAKNMGYYLAVNTYAQERQRSEEFNRAIIQSSPLPIFSLDLEGNVLTWNAAAEQVLGWERNEVAGKPLPIVPEDKQDEFRHLMQHVALEGGFSGKEVVRQRKDGQLIDVSLSTSPIYDAQGQVYGIMAALEDITKRKRSEEALRESEARYQELFNSIRDAILVSDTDRNIIDCNTAFTELFGYNLEEVKGQKTYAVYNDLDEFQRMGEEIKKNIDNPNFLYTINYIKKNGQVFPGETNVFYLKNKRNEVTGFIGIIRDVSERERVQAEKDRMEMQLRQAQKMEAIGRLAGGVAHDFNNLLTTITGNAELGLMDLDSNQELYELMQEIKEAGERAGNLTRQLLAFSRRQILQPEILDLNDLILDLEKMLRRLIGEDISLETHLSSSLGLVEADPGQMEQVIMNLAVNARDAMPEGGQLSIETANIDLDENYARGYGHLVTPGPYVMLAVSDTGMGLSLEMQDQVFDPFFTTKEKGKGTGLGLSIVYGIVKQSKGNIWVYSEIGKGTTFKIYLPRAEKVHAEREAKPEDKPSLQGTETVLVVEDEPSVRKIAVKNLARFGYTVFSAATGEEAMAICKKHKAEIDVLLTDVVMPGISGKDLVQALQEQGIDVSVVFMSGYTDNAIVHHGVLDPGICFLQKPFTPESLARKIREALDQDERG